MNKIKSIYGHIVFYDGVCHLCDSTVRFIIKFDRKKIFYFSSLQSDFAKRVLGNQHPGMGLKSTVVYLKHDTLLTKSTATLNLMKTLGLPFSLLYVFVLIPPFVRNWVYDMIALRRYRWFGQAQECIIPAKHIRDRFIED